jgi:hypothetical protein
MCWTIICVYNVFIVCCIDYIYCEFVSKIIKSHAKKFDNFMPFFSFGNNCRFRVNRSNRSVNQKNWPVNQSGQFLVHPHSKFKTVFGKTGPDQFLGAIQFLNPCTSSHCMCSSVSIASLVVVFSNFMSTVAKSKQQTNIVATFVCYSKINYYYFQDHVTLY